MRLSSGLFVAPIVRAPRIRVLANGSLVAGVIDAEVTSNNHFAADRFAVNVALSAAATTGIVFWAGTTDISLEIQISLDAGGSFVSLVQGTVDTVDIDPVKQTVHITGRDLTAALVETRTQETFANRTSSDIATLLALRHNMTPQVTPTTTPVGRYYQDQHDRTTLDQFSRATTEWDLLVFLARQEGFDVFVQGTTLNFQPASQQADEVVTITPEDVMDMRLERALTLAQDIEVVVKSWNSRQQNAFTQTARATGQRGGGSDGRPQRYVYVRPNLTSDQALKLAQQMLAELSRHERVINLTMPGELTITPRARIMLRGTNTEFDQLYFVDEIERHLRVEGGFVQRLRAKNGKVGSESMVPTDTVASVTG